jgi:HAD superfamily hydrolase (TIGR01509 family)
VTGLIVHSIDAVLLDIDGTIADTDDALVARTARWLRPLQRVLPAQDAQAAARRVIMGVETPVNAIVSWLDRTGLDQWVGPMMNTLHHLRGLVRHSHAQLIPGVEAALTRLAEHFLLGIVTAREHRSASSILQAHGLTSLFRCVATARTCRRAKPHPDPVLWAARQIGVSPKRCLMVGDTTADILAGRAGGLQTVGVLCGFGDRDELALAGADLILNSTGELVDVLLT